MQPTRPIVRLLPLLLALFAVGCAARSPKPAAAPAAAHTLAIVPAPVSLELRAGNFPIDDSTRILWERGNADAKRAARYLAESIQTATGLDLDARATPLFGSADGAIVLTTQGSDKALGAEGYRLSIGLRRATIRARSHGGFVAGVATVRQLLPASPSAAEAPLALPALEIRDQPRFQWRGMHLDVCRHFMPLDFVKQYVDLLAQYKFNVFHWHLTEDQGWRIEIKRYPRLTEVGAWRFQQGGAYGGFYTQAQVREVVAYAAERGITVVPEIEMPGHAMAALAAYPELSCTGGPFEVATKWGIFDDVYCAGNDATFEMLEGVLEEVLELFPSNYIHIGGDECPKKRWKECPRCQERIRAEGLSNEDELQSYFVRRVENWLNSHGRQLIGWDEILEGGLAPRATVMSWRGIKGGIEAARQGHDVVMSPTTHMYFDYRQSSDEGELGATYTKRTIDLATAYSYEPIPEELTAAEAGHVLGAQANVWTERLATPADVEYMVLPRMCAVAEITWSPASARNYDDFLARIRTHYSRFAAQGHNYRRY